ncbi:LacI family transcriptional regulator [Eubacteriales bacterium OttesenSCG-928-K08]|nr:LacI family transcriptional regulator [Eubacteriales bacterium OttesenSCG-928-K08]
MYGVTILDIAKITGFSKATVARAFANPEQVRPATLEIIRTAARTMGYRPNAIARAMITKRTGNLAFIIYGKQAPVITNPFYGPVLESVVNAAQRKGYSVFIVSDEEMRLPSGSIMLEKQVDGTIFASQPDPEMLNLYKSTGTPVVLLNHVSETDDVISVTADDYGGVFLAVEHLYSLGRRSFALIEGNFTEYIRNLRKQAYIDALKKFGLVYDERMVELVEPHVADAELGMRNILERSGNNSPDAVLCMNDIIAAGAMKALQAAGRRIPQDTAVVGYDDSSICTYCNPELTSIDGGKERMGEEAVRILCELIEKKENVEPVCLDVRLSIKGSTVSK